MTQAEPTHDASPRVRRRPTRQWPVYAAALVLLILGAAYALRPGGPLNSGAVAFDHRGLSDSKEPSFMPNIDKPDEDWRAQLTPEQFEVTRRGGTERPFSGKYWNHKEDGEYHCVGCGARLFTSETKYDSGCGWPSFSAPSDPEHLHQLDDRKYGMLRTEVRCQNCGAHLGHVFDDGPQPTGLRYCINSAALDFEKQAESKEPTK